MYDGERLSPYQSEGYVFATDNPKFTEDFFVRRTVDPKILNKQKFDVDDIKAIAPGEGNIYPVHINTTKMFDPDNPKHMSELFTYAKKRHDAGIDTSIKGAIEILTVLDASFPALSLAIIS